MKRAHFLMRTIAATKRKLGQPRASAVGVIERLVRSGTPVMGRPLVGYRRAEYVARHFHQMATLFSLASRQPGVGEHSTTDEIGTRVSCVRDMDAN